MLLFDIALNEIDPYPLLLALVDNGKEVREVDAVDAVDAVDDVVIHAMAFWILEPKTNIDTSNHISCKNTKSKWQ
jgi:hypothetical protein